MKLSLALVALTALCAVTAAPQPRHEPIGLYYHERYGIAEAARIKAAEQAADFDGARIVGGSTAALGQYPHLGGLVITLATGATSVCGSSLISNNRLVTAAHCWTDGRLTARQLTVVLGSLRLFSGGLRVATNQVLTHASYNPANLNNDIAVIVTSWISFTGTINRIALATGTNQFVGQVSQAAGFGRTADNANISQNQALSHVSMAVITNAACQRVYGSVIVASTICTDTAGGRSVCQGDSGGSLQVGNTLVGVTSFVAAAGCSRGFPAGFARVTSFAAWIQARL